MQMNEEFGCMYRRFRKNRRRKSFDFERIPAVKIQAANGAVLLKPLPAMSVAPVNRPPYITVTLVEGVTVQLAAEPNGRPQEPKAPHNDGSGQWSKLIVGMGKSACIGNKF